MTDDRQPPEGAEPRTDRGRRSEAQGAAADLARMGIDPRSLGLDTPQSQTPERRWTQEADRPVVPRSAVDDANVVALRPEWATQAHRGPTDGPGSRSRCFRNPDCARACACSTWSRRNTSTAMLTMVNTPSSSRAVEW